MRNKTLGFVLDVKQYVATSGENRRVLLIHWVTTDRLLPRHSTGWYPGRSNQQELSWREHTGYGTNKPKNPIAWYDEGDYLECANLE
jgi:hypothetical protein